MNTRFFDANFFGLSKKRKCYFALGAKNPRKTHINQAFSRMQLRCKSNAFAMHLHTACIRLQCKCYAKRCKVKLKQNININIKRNICMSVCLTARGRAVGRSRARGRKGNEKKGRACNTKQDCQHGSGGSKTSSGFIKNKGFKTCRIADRLTIAILAVNLSAPVHGKVHLP